ncbi:MAG: hypothetical protein ABW164_06285 [Sphingobium sp.]
MSFAAILSASRPSGDPTANPRASLIFAGQTLVEYQARQAARAGAERILILVGVVTPALSQAVDRLSADGIAVGLVRDTVSMLRDAPRDSDILLVADGAAIAQPHFQAMAQAAGNALLVVDDSRASAPFERIDAGQRWAGLARVSPQLLFDTIDMVGDWDLALTLVRGTVQAGARRITVPQDDLLEGRVVLVETQQQAELAQMSLVGTARAEAHGGDLDHYLLAPLARLLGGSLMRLQVPAMQMRVLSILLAAIALVPIELLLTVIGFVVLVVALLALAVADRLDQLALRPPARGWGALTTPALALAAIWRASPGTQTTGLVLLLGILLLAVRRGRTAQVRPWMVLSLSGTALLLCLAAAFGWLAAGLDLLLLLAIGSVGAIILIRKPN